jgi:hypothetical protein
MPPAALMRGGARAALSLPLAVELVEADLQTKAVVELAVGTGRLEQRRKVVNRGDSERALQSLAH